MLSLDEIMSECKQILSNLNVNFVELNDDQNKMSVWLVDKLKIDKSNLTTFVSHMVNNIRDIPSELKEISLSIFDEGYKYKLVFCFEQKEK